MALLNALFFVPIILLLKYILNINPFVKAVNWSETKWRTTPKALTESDFITLSHLTEQDYQQFNETLDNLLIPRVPGSDGHKAVRQFITDYMRSLDWSVDFDEIHR